ncbi:uncharacterized protein K460DRAFT_20358 [Cucurbitaria berberidis CBS 394.84]|uniref:Protein kinase domain-containing protein n=1 Tax=Cucurbitaria berberidis CBS 394.84 TaxID=1168544 RepID=A0A9P4GRX9_9PLEO|nr:uncharacterized protein K460DRAFT_20358 [Cucurbitaria berberidis CBS 394.84]KAF1850712.1 hypothetical protein K460DRAFT_20358 [Cucurbitaria berberidis CBS 394.84]
MPELTPIRRRYKTTQTVPSASVEGPAEFIKLALDQLDVPYIYFKRTLRQEAATGASFQVRYFDINPENFKMDTKHKIETRLKLKQGQWLVAKHIAPPTPELREVLGTSDVNGDGVRLGSMVKEMRILAHEPLRSHRNIVQLLGFSWEKQRDELDRRWPILIMETADCGSLKDFLELADISIQTPTLRISLASDIASGLEALHRCRVVHGDIKPENVLIYQLSHDTFQAKISDFGSASLIEDLKSEIANTSPYVSLEGFTPPWDAPEAFGEIVLEDLCKVDVYAFGLLACHLAAFGTDVFSDFRKQSNGDIDTEYTFDQIAALKKDSTLMIGHAKKHILSNFGATGNERSRFLQIMEWTLEELPSNRKDMAQIRGVLCTTDIEEQPRLEEHVPSLPANDPSSDEHPQYQDLRRWDQDLMIVASGDIISTWHQRSLDDMASNDASRIEQGAQRLFWLCRGVISGALDEDESFQALKWLLISAEAGSGEAQASVYPLLSALEEIIPAESIHHLLVNACYSGETLAEVSLRDLYPDSYSEVLQHLKTTYCGYGQDCFGEQWRNEYPLDYLTDTVEDWLEDARDINELHDYPGMACGMSWLHYAASNGRQDLVTHLVAQGADPNVLNDYDESPLFMACQAGHFGVVQILCPLTRNDKRDTDFLASNELHNLTRFGTDVVEAVKLLLDWGADINQQNSDRQQTPLAFTLNDPKPSSMEAAGVLLVLGADPLIEDYHGLDCLALAACQLSPDLIQLVLGYIPPHQLTHSKAKALCSVLEMEKYEILVNGAKDYRVKVYSTLKLLVDFDTCEEFQDITGHSALTFACANSTLAMVQCLFNLLPDSPLNEWQSSAEGWTTPLMGAIVQNRFETVEYLLGIGADATILDPVVHWSPLFYAVSGRPRIVLALVQSIEKNHSSATAIHYVNIRDDGGFTAFDVAVAGDFFDAADILTAYSPAFLAHVIPYSVGSTTLYNFLGSTVYKAGQLFYLLNLIGTAADLPVVDNEGVTLLHAVSGVPIGELSCIL